MRTAGSTRRSRNDSESIIACDTVILAIGQAPNLDFLKPEDGVKVSPRGLIVADRETLMTSAPGVFAGGDCVFGPRLIIDSVGDGKRIAIAIDEYLTGRKHPEPEDRGRGARSPQDVRGLHEPVAPARADAAAWSAARA